VGEQRKPKKGRPEGTAKGAARGAVAPRARGPSRAKAKPPARALPAPDGDAPLHDLTRDELSVFLYAALLPEENLQIVRELGLSVPGFRTEALSEPERCDLIADEVRAAPELRIRILEALRNGFGRPPLVGVALDEREAQDLVDVGTTEHGTVLALWRLLADPSPSVRALARPLLARMVAEYYGPADEGGAEVSPPEEPASTGRESGRLRALERELSRARDRAERAQAKGAERAEKLQAQLKEARAAEARAVDDAARARSAAEQARSALQRSEAALEAARGTDAAAEVNRARLEARELSGKLAAAEARAERAEARVADAERSLAEAVERAAPSAAATSTGGTAGGETEEPEEAPPSWLLPVYTREFYDSLQGWERRVQRAAFKQAHLLAQDHRHPSLRALPLEGLPGYYRVRVATDVRLIYRRGEQQSAVEILSLIDREDLDRYVRQAKTRG
jgi:mRNA-degrading endonuclease RelE of RelBE toxin-antitoxin system